jgi:O-antigen ligase
MLISESKYSMLFLWFTVAVSSIVFIEPAPTDLLSILALGLFFTLGMRIPPNFGLPVLLMGIYLVSNVFAGVVAPDPGDTIRPIGVRFYMALSCLLYVCVLYENPPKVAKVIWNGYIVAALIAIIGGIFGFLGMFGLAEIGIENGRVRAFHKDPNVYGPFVVPVAIYALAKLETAAKNELMGYWLLLAFTVLGMLLGFSRGSFVNFAIAVLLYFFLRLRTQRSPLKRKRVMGIFVGLIIGSVVVIAGAATTEKVRTMMDKRLKVVQYYDMGEEGRLTRQMEVLREITVTPLGMGPGQSEKNYTFGQAPHNVYLHVLIEAGWIGGFAFIFFAFYTTWRGWRFIHLCPDVDGTHIAVFACIVGILAQSVFIDSTHWRHLFLLFGLMWGPMLAAQTKGLGSVAPPQALHPGQLRRRAV